jgi:hypothetical protein
MANVPLSIPERSALLALMTFVTETSNTEIRERYGFTIDKKVRESLVAHRYLAARRAVRNTYVHELTDKGWARCREELAAPAPDRAQRGYRILYGVLHCLDRYLSAAGLTMADFVAVQDKPEVDDQHVEDRLHGAYDMLASRPGAWVGLARLRAALPGVARQSFDAALLRLDLMPHVYLIPEANQKALTDSDRQAAIHVGGEDKHLLSIRPV